MTTELKQGPTWTAESFVGHRESSEQKGHWELRTKWVTTNSSEHRYSWESIKKQQQKNPVLVESYVKKHPEVASKPTRETTVRLTRRAAKANIGKTVAESECITASEGIISELQQESISAAAATTEKWSQKSASAEDAGDKGVEMESDGDGVEEQLIVEDDKSAASAEVATHKRKAKKKGNKADEKQKKKGTVHCCRRVYMLTYLQKVTYQCG